MAFFTTFPILFILLPLEVDTISKKKCRKQNLVRTDGTSGGKVILTLLTEVKISHMGYTTINIGGLSLRGFFSGSFL